MRWEFAQRLTRRDYGVYFVGEWRYFMIFLSSRPHWNPEAQHSRMLTGYHVAPLPGLILQVDTNAGLGSIRLVRVRGSRFNKETVHRGQRSRKKGNLLCASRVGPPHFCALVFRCCFAFVAILRRSPPPSLLLEDREQSPRRSRLAAFTREGFCGSVQICHRMPARPVLVH